VIKQLSLTVKQKMYTLLVSSVATGVNYLPLSELMLLAYNIVFLRCKLFPKH